MKQIITKLLIGLTLTLNAAQAIVKVGDQPDADYIRAATYANSTVYIQFPESALSGVILSPTLIMTAAHGLDRYIKVAHEGEIHNLPPHTGSVILGNHTSMGRQYPIKRFITHPLYFGHEADNQQLFQSDIAILELANPIEGPIFAEIYQARNPAEAQAGLEKYADPFKPFTATIYGYGKNRSGSADGFRREGLLNFMFLKTHEHKMYKNTDAGSLIAPVFGSYESLRNYIMTNQARLDFNDIAYLVHLQELYKKNKDEGGFNKAIPPLSAYSDSGDSGGPIFDNQGRLIGLVTGIEHIPGKRSAWSSVLRYASMINPGTGRRNDLINHMLEQIGAPEYLLEKYSEEEPAIAPAIIAQDLYSFGFADPEAIIQQNADFVLSLSKMQQHKNLEINQVLGARKHKVNLIAGQNITPIVLALQTDYKEQAATFTERALAAIKDGDLTITQVVNNCWEVSYKELDYQFHIQEVLSPAVLAQNLYSFGFADPEAIIKQNADFVLSLSKMQQHKNLEINQKIGARKHKVNLIVGQNITPIVLALQTDYKEKAATFTERALAATRDGELTITQIENHHWQVSYKGLNYQFRIQSS